MENLDKFFVVFLLLNLSGTTSASPTERRLIDTLLANYSKLTRPIASEGDLINIKIGMSLLQIVDVNEKQQTLSTNLWLRTTWTDISMTWDPLKYDNITLVRIPIFYLWKPDVLVYNMADEEIFQSTYHREMSINANIYNDGVVLFVPPMVLKTTCKMDVTWFPFDSQRCEIQVGSWTHSALQMDLKLWGGNLSVDMASEYLPNGEWKLLNIETKRMEKIYDCCPEAYVSVSFTLHIKRQRMYYFFNLVVPCGLIGFLAILGFTLPPDSGEKLSLGVTVLFSLIVFLNMIAESMPSNSGGVPLLGTYFNCVMFMIASSVVSTVVINLKVRSAHRPPRDVGGGAVTQKLLFNILPWMLRMEAKNEFFKTDVVEGPSVTCPLREGREEDNNGNDDATDLGLLNGDAELVLKKKWMFIAVLVDRFCLAVSVVFILISIAILLISTLCYK